MNKILIIIFILLSSLILKSNEPDMKNVLIVYSSFSGSTEEIADSMKTYLEKENCVVDIKIADDKICDFTKYDFIILGSAIQGDNPHENILKFINTNRTELTKKQVAVFAVCITITSSKEKRKINAQTYPDKIANGLIPFNKTVFAGKTPFSGWFGNLMGKMFLGIISGDYRDWTKIKDWTLSLKNK